MANPEKVTQCCLLNPCFQECTISGLRFVFGGCIEGLRATPTPLSTWPPALGDEVRAP